MTAHARAAPASVYVHGPSGIGKSALVRRFLDQLSASGDVVVLRGRCYEQESVPYKALDGVIDSLSHYLALSAASASRGADARATCWRCRGCFRSCCRSEAIAASAAAGARDSPIRSSCGAARSPRCANC